MDSPVKELPPVPCIGGPKDGEKYTITILFPFIGGGVPCGLLTFGNHYYRLKDDRSAWEYGGVLKEAEHG